MCFDGNKNYVLPENQRKYFKEPLDKLFCEKKDIENIIRQISKDESIPKIITVGDVITETLLNSSIVPDLAIIDEQVQRKKIEKQDYFLFEQEIAENPAGSITQAAWNKISFAIKKDANKIIIKIKGEEDLLVLPAILEAPYNSKVLYGQPNEGVVLVTVTKEMKQKAKQLLLRMVKVDEN
ncbi:MAG: GTP-dependent dephospho-CoA kinase family protein [Candidatus Heimdallarchaeaceae archaeon]